MSEPIPLIPVVKTGDPRYETHGDINTPVVNFRMRISLSENPGFALDFDGREAAWAAADLIRAGLSENYKRGLDARGAALPPVALATTRRRERRAAQYAQGSEVRGIASLMTGKRFKETREAFKAEHASTFASIEALRERYRLRGKSPSGKRQYDGPADMRTPFAESGLAADNVYVYWKGYNKTTGEGRGDPEFAIAWPSGGKGRGLSNDDGRGARLFAVQHYGFERMADIPTQVEQKLDAMLDNYLSRLLLVGRAPTALFAEVSDLVGRAASVIDEAAEGDPED